MKLSLEQKLRLGHALWVSELMEATGYSRAAIKRIGVPLVAGKCRLPDFWAYVRRLRNHWDTIRVPEPTEAPASPVPSNDPLSGAGTPHGPHNLNGTQVSLRQFAESLLRTP